MRYFTCLLQPAGGSIPESLCNRYAASKTRSIDGARWTTAPGFAAAVGLLEGRLGPSVERSGPWVAVGDVRLDNPEAVAKWSGNVGRGYTDLRLVLEVVSHHGTDIIPRLLGDFAFIAWHTYSRKAVAARDAFGIRTLFYSRAGECVALSSRPSLLKQTETYDLEFIADWLVEGVDPSERNPFGGVTTLPSGCILEFQNGSFRTTEYWPPKRLECDRTANLQDQVETFRTLFATAVRVRLTEGDDTWAQLSGGLDSSSVVCTAHALKHSGLVREGVSGTLTIVDSFGTGDEREFSDAVVQRCGVRNEQVVDDWMWRDDGQLPPLTEGPTALYQFYARDRRCCELVRRGGGRILLTGQGSDHYLAGLPYFLADWIAGGRWGAAVREMTRWSVLTRRSFWKFGFEHGLLPLLPRFMRHGSMLQAPRIPAWVNQRFAKAYDLARRTELFGELDGPWDAKYDSAVLYGIRHYGRYSNLTWFEESLDVRHPFLYRPLVEFSLHLPPALRTQPVATKWILREAMRDTLPEIVRTRSSKGGADERAAWSLLREHERVDELVRDSILEQLGCIDSQRLKRAVDDVREGRQAVVGPLLTTLGLETWLRARSNWWTVRESAPPRAAMLA